MTDVATHYFRWDHDMLFIDTPGHSGFLAIGFLSKPGWKAECVNAYYNRYALVYVLRGKGEFVDHNGKRHKLSAGSIFRRDPAYKHSLYIAPKSDWCECYLSMTHSINDHVTSGKTVQTDRIPTILELFDLQPEEDFVRHPGIQIKFIEEFEELLSKLRHTPQANALTLQADFIGLAARLWHSNAQESVTDHQWELVKQARDIIAQNATTRVHLTTLLAPVPASYSKLRQAFKKRMGMSPGDYRVKVRINRAVSKLLANDISIQQIAEELGYHDQFVFSRQFKQIMGVAPLNFRKKNQM